MLTLGAATACSDSGSVGPRRALTGDIRLSVSMTGADLPATYVVLVADRSVSGSASQGVVVGGLQPGTYGLTLVVQENCQVADENPRRVTVLAGQTAELAFSVTCAARTGVLRVTTVTTGVDLDPDGYQLRVQGYSPNGRPYVKDGATGANEAVILSAIPNGETTVTLSTYSVNCDPVDATRQTVFVPPAETVSVAFKFTCTAATGQIAYVVGMAPGIRHIYLIGVTGRGARRLTADDASDEDPAWSPDGKKMAFTSDRDGNREIYVVDADGSGTVRLTSDPAADYAPAWSRDGTKIAFVSERTGTPDIFTMNADGSSLVRLTSGTRPVADPTWSPDGRITFASRPDGQWDLYTMNADGSGTERLTTFGGAQPAWSADGTSLAYSSVYCPSFGCRLVILVISSGTSQVAAGIGPGERPSWSPDGRKIAYSGLRCDGGYDGSDDTCLVDVIRIARLDQPEVTDLVWGSHPAWRP